MLIILLRNTTYLIEELLVLVSDSSEPVVDGRCDMNSSDVTKLTALITPFYYFLLLVVLCFTAAKIPWTKLRYDDHLLQQVYVLLYFRLTFYLLYGRFKAAPIVDLQEEVEIKPHTVTEVAIGQNDGEISVNTTVVLQ